RCRAQAGLAEQDRGRRLPDEPHELARFGIAPAEEALRGLVERAEARPRVLGVDRRAGRDRLGRHAGCSARRLRISAFSSSRRASLGLPSGACPKGAARKLSGPSRKRPALPPESGSTTIGTMNGRPWMRRLRSLACIHSSRKNPSSRRSVLAEISGRNREQPAVGALIFCSQAAPGRGGVFLDTPPAPPTVH